MRLVSGLQHLVGVGGRERIASRRSCFMNVAKRMDCERRLVPCFRSQSCLVGVGAGEELPAVVAAAVGGRLQRGARGRPCGRQVLVVDALLRKPMFVASGWYVSAAAAVFSPAAWCRLSATWSPGPGCHALLHVCRCHSTGVLAQTRCRC